MTSSGSAERTALRDWLARQNVAPLDLPPASTLTRLLSGPVPRTPRLVRCTDRLRVLMLLCQKIGSTGSGIVVKEMVDRAAAAGVDYAVVCGSYKDDAPAELFRVQPGDLEMVPFNTPPPEGVPFPIVGMSNRMPYESRTFQGLTLEELQTYLDVWAGRLRRCLAAFQPDVVHVHHLWLLAALAALESPQLPLVVSVHGTDLFRASDAPHLGELIRPWASRIDRLLALTPESVAVARSFYPLPAGVCEVFGNGFNPELFHPNRPVDATVLARYGIPAEDRPMVLTVAKFDQRKGIDWLIRAFAQVATREPSALLVIGGSGPAAEGQRYRELAAMLGIEPQVVFAGAVDYEDVGVLMNRAHVFVLPAFHEPFGLVVLEALACGCRVVTTDQAGPPSFVPGSLRQSGEAILVPGLPDLNPAAAAIERFTADLAEAMAWQLQQLPSAADRCRRARAVAHLTWDGYVQRLGRLYRQLQEG